MDAAQFADKDMKLLAEVLDRRFAGMVVHRADCRMVVVVHIRVVVQMDACQMAVHIAAHEIVRT